MEYIKTAIIGVNFQDLQKSSSSVHLFAEVVLLDKTKESLQPVLYQLKKEALYGTDDLSTIPKEFASMQRDAFYMIGEWWRSISARRRFAYPMMAPFLTPI